MEKYWLPWLVSMPAETSRAICSLIFGGVFERLPNLRVAFAHGGGSFPATIGRIEVPLVSCLCACVCTCVCTCVAQRVPVLIVSRKPPPRFFLSRFAL